MDPFIAAHQRGARLLSIGGKLTPVSLRDQMVRAQMCVVRAYEMGLFGQGEDLFVVVGAGASGATAAMKAAEKGVPTLLIEKADKAFRAQADCPTRWISPTLYDFPVDHWATGNYPPYTSNPDPPLKWGANFARDLAIDWRRQLDNVLQRQNQQNPLLEFRPFTKLVSLPDPDPGKEFAEVLIETNNPQAGIHRTDIVKASLVLWACGFGVERRYIQLQNTSHPTWGYAFWQKDPYGELDFGQGQQFRPQVLISGSGDGSLQDFLRVTTRCQTTKEICDQLSLSNEVLVRLMSAQDFAQRAFNWGVGPKHDHGEMQHLHDAYQDVVNRLLNDPPTVSALQRIVKDPVPELHLVVECTHFSACYGLNRFLALLVGAFIERSQRRTVLLFRHRLKELKSIDQHSCSRNPNVCHGKMHKATLVELPDCRDPEGKRARSIEANVLIIRHGLDLSSLPWDPTPPVFRQALPYQFPR